jgi:hypothetical protein
MKFILLVKSFVLWCKPRFKPETKPLLTQRDKRQAEIYILLTEI